MTGEGTAKTAKLDDKQMKELIIKDLKASRKTEKSHATAFIL